MTDNNNNNNTNNATAITRPNNEYTSSSSPSSTQPSLDDDEEILLAKRMFLAGLLGLPWLWLCNVLYFRKRVFGPMRFVDYWPGGGNDDAAAAADDAAATGTNNGTTTTDPATTSLTMQQQLHQQLQFQHLQKWVHRSTFSALLVISVFVAWIIGFQVNKDAFSDKWFVVTVDEGEATGW